MLHYVAVASLALSVQPPVLAPSRIAPRALVTLCQQPQIVTDAQNKLAAEGEGDSASPLKMVTDAAQPWVSTYTAQPELLAGDLIALTLFAAIGRASHGENALNPIADVLTAFPFILSYLVAAKPLGGFEEKATADYQQMLHALGPTWAATAAGGCVLRSVSKFAIVPLTFVITSSIFTFLLMAVPRAFQVYKKTGELPDTKVITDKLGL